MKRAPIILKNISTIGNVIFIIWIVLHGINEGFGEILFQTLSYYLLIVLLFLNIATLLRYNAEDLDSDSTGFFKPYKFTRKRLIALSITLLILISVMSYLFYLKNKYPTAQPFTSISYTYDQIKSPHEALQKDIIGFLPYWRMDDTKYLKFDLLSEIIYFSLTVNEKGEILKVVDGETDPGWRWWNSDVVKDLVAKTQISGAKISVAIAMHENDTIEKFLDDQDAQKNLNKNLLELIRTNNLDGINIDFEYAGEPTDESYREKFTQFNTQLSSELKSNIPEIELSIDFYPFSVQKPRLFDVPKLEPLFDKIIVMSYDYYGVSSNVAGPVAPMYGYAEEKYLFDVSSTYSDYINVVPKEKIIMGIPYYAWDYPVTDGTQPMSSVLPQNDINGYTSVMSYGRMRTNTDIKPENCVWDDLAKQNWCYYQDATTGKYRQIWLEDNQSLEIKFDFAKENDLGGIAIWTLGYDKEYPDLWNMIREKFVSIE